MRTRTKQKLKKMALVALPIICIGTWYLVKQHKEQTVITQDKIAEVEELTKEQKLEDFQYLHSFIEENYPLLKTNKKINGVDWSAEKENFKKSIENTKSDAAFVGEIERMVQKLNDSSTVMVSEPIFKNYYSGYVNSEHKDKYTEEINILTNPTTLKRYRFDESQLKIVEDLNKDSQQRGATDLADFKTDIIVENEVAYIKFRSMNYGRIDEDGKLIRSFLEEVKDYKKLIIDVRTMNYWVEDENVDDNQYWVKNIVEPLIKEEISWDTYAVRKGDYGQKFQEDKGLELYAIEGLNKISNEDIAKDFNQYAEINRTIKPVNPIDFKGEIYIIINKDTVILGENFAAFAKETGFGNLVGEKTTHYDFDFPNIIVSLPNSGLIVTMRDMVYLNNDGSIRYEVGVTPDFEANTAKASTYERDQAVQYIINK